MKYGSAKHVSNIEYVLAKCKSRLKANPNTTKRWKERIAEYEKVLKDIANPRAKAAAPGASVGVPVGSLKGKGA
jgi:hypothetical protein